MHIDNVKFLILSKFAYTKFSEKPVIVHCDVHQLIHAVAPETTAAYLKVVQPDKKALAKLNALRVMAGNPEI